MVHKRFSRRDWFMGATLMALTGCAEKSSEGASSGSSGEESGASTAPNGTPTRRGAAPVSPTSATSPAHVDDWQPVREHWAEFDLEPFHGTVQHLFIHQIIPLPPRGVRQRGGAGLRRLVHHQVGGRRPARRAARPSLRPRVAGRLLRASRARRGAQPRAARASRSQAPRPVDRRPQLQPFPPGQGVHGPDHHRLDRAPVEYRQGPVDRQTVQRTHELDRRTARRVPACPS